MVVIGAVLCRARPSSGCAPGIGGSGARWWDRRRFCRGISPAFLCEENDEREANQRCPGDRVGGDRRGRRHRPDRRVCDARLDRRLLDDPDDEEPGGLYQRTWRMRLMWWASFVSGFIVGVLVMLLIIVLVICVGDDRHGRG